MKKTIILASLLLAGLSFQSCNDEFLESSPTETISNPPVEFRVNGLYNMMIDKETGGTTGHDDFGQKGYDIFTDLVQSDVVLDGTTYGWYSGIANYSWVIDQTNTRNYLAWRYYYRLIYGANDIIDDLGGTETTTFATDTEKHAFGQALAMRAYAYFYLVQMYTPTYTPSEEAIPLYTSKFSVAQPKSTQAEVYALIVDDLTRAQNLLADFTRSKKAKVDKTVAAGLLAYTYAAMGENAKAATEAAKIVNSSYPITAKNDVAYDPADLGPNVGFNNLNSPSWLWGFDITTDNDMDLISWWGQMDIFTYSYSWVGDTKSIDANLRASIRPDDVRLKQFAIVPGYNDTYTGTGKFFAAERNEGGQRTVTTDYLFMRADEFHLLYAETLAKSGQEANAKTVLKNFLTHRVTNTSFVDALSGQALLDEIYNQTRLEMWGEGKAYLAMKRNNKPVVRGNTHLFYAGETIPVGDNRTYFKVPQAEILDNPFIN